MPYSKKLKESGSVDTITIIGVLFLLVTLGVGAFVLSDEKYNFNIFEKAGVDGGIDTLSGNPSGRNVGTTTNNSEREAKLEAKKKQQAKDDDNSEQQQAPATTKPKFADGCSVNGSNLSIGSKVIGGANIAGTNTKGSSGYAICDANLGWIDCPSCDNNSLTTLPTYVKTELENTCINNGNTWDSLSNTCITQNTTTPITISQNSNTGYVSLSDSVRDVQVQQNNIQYQQQTTNTNNKNSGSLNNIKTGGGTKSLNNTNTNTILPYVPISYSQINNIVKNMPGMEWYNYITSQNTSTSDSVKTFKTNLATDTTLNKNVNINTLTQSINSESQTNLNDNNFGTNCGKPGLSAEEREKCTNIARVAAYNSTIVGDYIKSFSNQDNIFEWQRLGYSDSSEAIKDCVDKNGINSAYNCTRQMSAYGKEQVTSSIDLGTDIASIITLPAAPVVFGPESLLKIGIGTLGSTMTVQQSKNAVIAQIEDPGFLKAKEDINPDGFLEAIDPQTYLTDAGYQTTMAALGWWNIAGADRLMTAWSGTNQALQQSARVENTIVSGINLYFDTPYAINTCRETGLFSDDCKNALVNPTMDLVFGALDVKQNQLTLNPFKATAETIEVIKNSRVNNISLIIDDGYSRFDNNTAISVQQELLDPTNNLYSPEVSIRQGDAVTVFNSPSEASDFYRNLTGQNPPPGTISTNTLSQTPAESEIENILTQVSRNQTADDMLFAPAQRPVIPETGGGTNLNNWTDGLTSWWQQTVGDLNFRGLENEELTVPNRNQADNIVQNLPDDFQAGPRVFNANGDNLPSATEINIPRPIVNAIENYVYSRTGGVLPFINNIIAPNRTVDLNYTPPTPLTTRIGDWIDRTVGNNPVINRLIGRPEEINLRPNEVTLDSVDKPARLPSENLAKGIVGIEIGDTAMTPRLLDDHYSLKQKYGLPDRGLRFENPNEYIVQLNRIAKENGIPIRDASEWESFFQRHLAGAVFDDTGKQVFVDFRIAINDPITYGGLLEHELIHALQDKRYPGMSVEVMEYEAYITANMSLTNVQNDPRNIQETLFNNIEFSINHWYEEKNLPNPWLDNKSNINTSPTTGFLPAVSEFGVNIRNGFTDFFAEFANPLREVDNTQVRADNNNLIDNIIARFNRIGQPDLANQEVSNVARLTPDNEIAVPAGLLDDNVGQAKPKFTQTDSTIAQDIPPTAKKTVTVIKDAIDYSPLPPVTKSTKFVNPTLPIVGLLSLGVADYIIEEVFDIDIFDFKNNKKTMSQGIKLDTNFSIPTIVTEPVAIIEKVVTDIDQANETVIKPVNEPDFVYYSQKDQVWQDLITRNGATIRVSGCGIVTGGMVTKLNPKVYYQYYLDYFKSQNKDRTLDKGGTSWEDHRAVLESMGYTIVPISGDTYDIKEQIKKYTDNGIPIWINADFYGIGHHVMATGINDQTNEIILNDPWRGEGFNIDDKYIDKSYEDGDDGWRIYAIIPPSGGVIENQNFNNLK